MVLFLVLKVVVAFVVVVLVVVVVVVFVVLVEVVVVLVLVKHSNPLFHKLQQICISDSLSSSGHKKFSWISQFFIISHIGSQFALNENGCAMQNRVSS